MEIKPIFMQAKRPAKCAECNLCVKRPSDDVPCGSKFTYYCLLLDKPLSGRGIKAADKERRFRCHPNVYRAAYCNWNGRFPVGIDKIIHYNVDETKLPI